MKLDAIQQKSMSLDGVDSESYYSLDFDEEEEKKEDSD